MSYSISRKAKNFKLSGFFKLSIITLQSDSWGKQFASSRSRSRCSHFIVLVIVGSVIGIGKCKEEDESFIVVVGGKIIFLLVMVVAVACEATDVCVALEHLL
jgi:hypothetical protein